jgi:hypothetical protein
MTSIALSGNTGPQKINMQNWLPALLFANLLGVRRTKRSRSRHRPLWFGNFGGGWWYSSAVPAGPASERLISKQSAISHEW